MRVAAIGLVICGALGAWGWLGSRASPSGRFFALPQMATEAVPKPVTTTRVPVAPQVVAVPPVLAAPQVATAPPVPSSVVVEAAPLVATPAVPQVPPVPAALPPVAARSPAEAPSFDLVRVSPLGETVLAGRAAPDATVAISAGGRVVAQAHADAQGQWVAVPDAVLPAGSSELTLAASAGQSQPVVAGSAPLLVIVPELVHPPSAPETPVASAAPREAPTALAMLLPGDAPPQLLLKPGAEAAHPSAAGTPVTALNVDQVDYPAGGAIRFAGTAHAGAALRLYVDDQAIGEAQADALGRWSMTPTAAITLGHHRVRVDEIGIRGQVAARVALPFERSEMAPDAVLAGRVVVQPHQTLWRIARHAYGQGIRYTVIYQANREQISDPARIYPGQVFTVPGLGQPLAIPSSHP